jgi:cysteine synthase A
MVNKLQLINNTPCVKLEKTGRDTGCDIYVKLEKYNLGGSIKDRVALTIIENAEARGELKVGDTIIEATSGNTGIGLCLAGVIKGYKVVIAMPENMSVERRQMMKAYGAELLLTPAGEGMAGSIKKAVEMIEEKGWFYTRQFENPDAIAAHYDHTGVEILKQVPEAEAFVTGIGTGGTLTGVGRRLKEKNSETLIIGLEPAESPIITEGKKGLHGIQGIGAGFIPDNLDLTVVDKVYTIETAEALEMTARLCREEGLSVGISTGANICGILKVIRENPWLKTVVTTAPDGLEKYLSVKGLIDV